MGEADGDCVYRLRLVVLRRPRLGRSAGGDRAELASTLARDGCSGGAVLQHARRGEGHAVWGGPRNVRAVRSRAARARQRWPQWGAAMVALAPLVGACYVYAPVATPEPQPGVRLALDLSDQGRVALVTSVGPDVARVEGTLVSDTGGQYVMRIAEVFGIQGTRTRWTGETVSLPQEYVKRVRERKLSRGRTVFAVAGLVGSMVGILAGTGLAGFGSGGDDRAGSGVGDGQ